jgi:hypothetical protein
MKINKGLLKQMIAEEKAKFDEKADPGKLNPKIPFKLSDTDMDAAKVIATAGDDDGSTEDDTIDVKVGASFAAKDLKPSQSTMSIANAAGMALAMLAGRMKYKDADLGGFIASDGHILDGHHRWIATLMVDPTANVKGALVQFPSKAIIPVLNTITKGLGGIDTGKEGKGSFSEFTEKSILGKLLDFAKNGIGGKHPVAPEQIRQDMAKATGMRNARQAAQALAKRFADNIASAGGPNFPVPEGAPDRIDMPVIGPDLKDQAIQALTQGLVDVNPPFGDDQQAAPEEDEQGEQEMQESKKDLLKRIVAEEIAKMEIDAVQKEGIFDFFRKKKKEEPAPEPELVVPAQELAKQKEAEALEAIKSSILLGSDDIKHISYFRDGYQGLRRAFGGRAMETGHYAAEAVADQFDEYPLKSNAKNMNVKDAIAQAIYNKSGKAPDKSYIEGVVDTLTRAAKDRYEYMTRMKGTGSSPSSSRKSDFERFMQDDEPYDYMTRMENLSKEQLANIVKETIEEEGVLEEIFGLFGDGKLKMIEKEIIPKFRKGISKLRRHHKNVPGHYWHYVTAEAVRRAYRGYQASSSPYKEATRKSKEWEKLGEEINALVMNAYNLVQTNALKDKYADAKDRKLMLDLDAYEKDAGYKGTARSYIP